MVQVRKACVVGFNHVALEVGDTRRLWLSTVVCSISFELNIHSIRRLELVGDVSLTPPITECPFKVGAISAFRIARFGGHTR